jgi:hypothetical protein
MEIGQEQRAAAQDRALFARRSRALIHGNVSPVAFFPADENPPLVARV